MQTRKQIRGQLKKIRMDLHEKMANALVDDDYEHAKDIAVLREQIIDTEKLHEEVFFPDT